MRGLKVAWLVGVACLVSAAERAGAQNLITNGDFESPGVVESDYTHTPGGNTDEGTWWVTPWDPGAPWANIQHTPGGVGAFNANGDNSSQAGVRRVWYRQVDVTPGRTYRFSAWALGTAAGPSGYALRFDADELAIGGVFHPTVANGYELHTGRFQAAGPTVVLSIKNVSGITFPNDFMLDDLSLVEECPGDFNGDGTLDFFDVQAFLNAYAQANPIADINADGQIDFFDVLAFLGAFSAGCA